MTDRSGAADTAGLEYLADDPLVGPLLAERADTLALETSPGARRLIAAAAMLARGRDAEGTAAMLAEAIYPDARHVAGADLIQAGDPDRFDRAASEIGAVLTPPERTRALSAISGLPFVLWHARRHGGAMRDHLTTYGRHRLGWHHAQAVRLLRAPVRVIARGTSRTRETGRPGRRTGASSRTSSADPGDPEPGEPAPHIARAT